MRSISLSRDNKGMDTSYRRNDSWGRLGGQAYVWSLISYPDLLLTKPICTRDRLSGMWQALKEQMLEINPQFQTG